MRTIYKILLALILSAPSLIGRAGGESSVTVRVQAPSEVIQGDRFRVSYVVNTSDVDDFRIDAFEGLVELYGPSRSQSYFCQLSTITRARPRKQYAIGVFQSTQRT